MSHSYRHCRYRGYGPVIGYWNMYIELAGKARQVTVLYIRLTYGRAEEGDLKRPKQPC